MTGPPPDSLSTRHRALAPLLQSSTIDAVVISHLPNIAYLSGFAGSSAFLVATAEGLHLLSDARYAQTLAELGRDTPRLVTSTVPVGGSYEESLVTVIESLGVTRVGFESRYLSVRRHLDLGTRLSAAGRAPELVPADGLVEGLRLIKDPWEMGVLREAGRRLSDVAKCIMPKALAGTAERELAAVIEWELAQKGFQKPAFDTIVAAGPNGAQPHYRAGDRRMASGDLVVVDFGGMFRGYAVDMTRTLTVGMETTRQADCLAAVGAAQRAAYRASAVGVAAEDVDAAARRVLDAAGMGEAFSHGLGHGLGLEVHERPRLTRRRPGVSEDILTAGMVFTLEPGVYFPGWGGVRIEDDVVTTDAGPEWLTEPLPEGRAT